MALAFFVSDLRELLDELPLVRRQAVLFALQADMELRDAVDLRWRDVGSLQLDALSEAILVARERHPKVDYVFWEELSNGVIAPLFGIHESVWASTAGLTMAQLRSQFKRMTWLDTRAEAASFKQELGEVLQSPVRSPYPNGA